MSKKTQYFSLQIGIQLSDVHYDLKPLQNQLAENLARVLESEKYRLAISSASVDFVHTHSIKASEPVTLNTVRVYCARGCYCEDVETILTADFLAVSCECGHLMQATECAKESFLKNHHRRRTLLERSVLDGQLLSPEHSKRVLTKAAACGC